ncbi:guanine nucleotide-binding protein subunit beta-2-like [Daphnia carinata]|uniref:guanine nucleotide-binding protein subunit beta-2-like n=1 Tax=Daphnia carinata TaxID=120202 RepID=UPI00257A7DDD|nr:guanine nucleotide-binding protein subunit beta-2-like [Daphnia carinata]
MPPKDDPETAALKQELQALIEQCKGLQKGFSDITLEAATSSAEDLPRIKATTRRMLKGHINKVTSCHYSGDSRHLVSGSLDGKLIVWDTWTGNKIQVIPLRSAWVMCSVFAPSGNYVACGGMDNMCTVYDVNNRDSSGTAKITRELAGYEGFLSTCRFLEDSKIVTGSGDMMITVWDLEAGKKLDQTPAHVGDVCSMSLKAELNLIVTGSVDRCIKLWDVRTLKCVQTFFGHEADVNSVCFHPSGQAFVSASEDKTARLFDIRSDQQVFVYRPPTANSSLTCCSVSQSGRILLAGSDDSTVHLWDLLKGEHNGNLQGHENRITGLSVADSGIGVATSSWDNAVRVWG